jgi:hypothetical protein
MAKTLFRKRTSQIKPKQKQDGKSKDKIGWSKENLFERSFGSTIHTEKVTHVLTLRNSCVQLIPICIQPAVFET